MPISCFIMHRKSLSFEKNKNKTMFMKDLTGFYSKAKPYMLMVFLTFSSAVMPIVGKFALNKGMNQYVYLVYRHALSTLVLAPFAIVLDRKVRPKMTASIFFQILLLALLGPISSQSLYYTGMKYSTATVATALSNVLPAFVFLLAWVCRLEKVKLKKLNGQAKILGTIGSVGGAMIMTVINGPILPLPWTEINNHNNQQQSKVSATVKEDPLKGAVMILGCFISFACFVMLQTTTLKSYPTEVSLTTIIFLMGTIGAAIFALIMERNNAAAWAIHWDYKLFAVVYGGIFSSAVAYYIGAIVIQAKGPVFFASFSPLTLVIVAIMSSFIFSEIVYLGRVIGAIVIVLGLYLVLWGTSKDQHSSDSDSTNDKTTNVPRVEQIITLDETPITSNQEFVVLDVSKGEEYVKKNPKQIP